ncbi:acyl-CoA N-acyltransferase [Melampsora americana]|nr:acyl-CoA N-acyltransferase [Melampsora americana]
MTTEPIKTSINQQSVPSPLTLRFRPFDDQTDDLDRIMELVEGELSEPYIIYTYRYFLSGWPQLCFLCFADGSINSMKNENDKSIDSTPVGAIVCKQETHLGKLNRGYIAMLTTKKEMRKKGIARRLVKMAIDQMVKDGAEEIVLETEFDNRSALAFYQRLGFIREKRLYAFYLNRKDAFRLVLPINREDDYA